MNTYFITGTSGFIGYYLAKRVLEENSNIQVIGLDNMNNYYDVRLKEYRLNELEKFSNYKFIKGDLSDRDLINKT